MAVRTATVEYVGDAASLIRASQQAAAATKAATAEIAGANEKVAGSSELMAARTAKAHEKMMASAEKANASFAKWGSTAGAAVIGVSVDMALKLEEAGVAIAKAGNTSSAAGIKIADAFKNLSGLEYSGAQVGKAFATIAGEMKVVEGHALGVTEATKVMTAALNLADASGGDLTATTESLGKVMMTFHLGAEQAAKASDVLFNASKATGTSIETFTTTVDKARGRLGALAPSFVETSALMAELAKQGVSGRLTMGSLGGVFGTLLSQSKKVTEQLAQLNVHVFDSKGKFVGLTSVIEQLHPVLGKYNEASQLMITRTLFGEKANKQMLEVIHQGVPAFEESTRAIDKHGTAAAAAAAEHKTLVGEAKIATAALANLSADMGLVFIPALKKAAEALADGVKWLKEHKTAAQALRDVIVGVLGVAMLDFAAVKAGKVIGAVKSIADGLKLLAGAFTTTTAVVVAEDGAMVTTTEAASVSMKAALMTTGIGATLVLLAGAAYELGKHWKEVSEAMEKVTQSMANSIIEQLNEVIEAYNATIGKITGDIGKIGKMSGAGERHAQEMGGEAVQAAVGAGKQKTLDVGGSVMGYFMSKGLTAAQAAGIAGNFQQESSLNPNMKTKEGTGLDSGTGSRAHGGSLKQQVEAYWKELTQSSELGLAALRKTHSPQEAARVFAEYFEKPKKGPTENLSGREEYAAKAFHAHPQAHSHAGRAAEGSPYGPESLAPTAAKAKKAKEEGYANPFAGASGVHQSRTDQGVDFGFAGSLGAVGKGRIVNIVRDPGGFGTEVVEELTEGPHKGQFVYYGLETGAILGISKGASVRSGQTIAHGKGSGGIELGFASSAAGVPVTPYGPGQSHGIPTAGGKAFESFLKSIGKGGSNLQLATAQFAETAKKAAAAIAHLTLSSAQTARVKRLEGRAAVDTSEVEQFAGYATEAGAAWEKAKPKQEAHRKALYTKQGQSEQTLIDEQDIQTAKARKKYWKEAVAKLTVKVQEWQKLRKMYLKLAGHTSGHAQNEAIEKASGYDGKIKKAREEAHGYEGSISDADETIAAAGAALGALPAEGKAAEAEHAGEVQSGDLTAYQAANSKIDMEEYAGLLTPEKAKAAKEANANKAKAGGYGALSEEGMLQVTGDLRQFEKALTSATSAVEAHAQAALEGAEAMTKHAQAAQKIAEVEAGVGLKAAADAISGYIAGVSFHGRAMTPGAGSAATY
jgi:TP901 family phage tail tape measure protein